MLLRLATNYFDCLCFTNISFFLSFLYDISNHFSPQKKKKKKIHQTIILISYMEWELLFPIPSLMDQVKVINWCTLGLGDRRKTYFPKSMWLNNATDHLNPFYSKNYCKPSSKNFAFFFFFFGGRTKNLAFVVNNQYKED